MTILILSSTDSKKTPYHEWFSNSKNNIILFCPSEKRKSYKQSDYLLIESFENYIENCDIESKAIELSKKYNITNILSISEFDVIRSAKLREILKLDGQSLISAEAYRKKVLMKQLLKNTAVNIPKFDKAISPLNIKKFIDNNGFPIVIKPIYGSGSIGVQVAYNQEDIASILKNTTDYQNLEIEEFIDGEMYHVDGLIHNGNVIATFVSHYYMGCLEFQSNRPSSTYMINKDNPLYDLLKINVKNVIAQLPNFFNGSFHAEFFVTETNEIYLCEIGSRTGGGEIGKAIEHSTGINLNKASLYLKANYNVESIVKSNITRYSGFILLPPRKAIYQGIKQQLEEEWVVSIKNMGEIGKKYDDARLSVDHIISVVIEGNNEEELIARINKVVAWYETNVKWERIMDK